MKTTFRTASLVVAGAVLGVVTAGAIGGAFAAGSDNGSGSSSSSTANPGDRDGDHGRGGGHAGEKALTGTDLTKATAAAEKAVTGGKVDRAETDSGDATYEVHMTKTDGSNVTVKLDKAFAVTGVESGMGK